MARTARSSLRRGMRRGLVATVVVGVAWLLTGPIAWAAPAAPVAPDAPVDAGDAMVVEGDDPAEALARGDGDTAYSLRLPDGAACPGDSLHDQWRIQTFMVPTTDEVGALAYGVIGPEGTDQYALFGSDFSAQSYANVLTPANAVAGEPGRIEFPTSFSFAVVAGESIPSGNYRIGVACTYFGATVRYWDAEVVVTNVPGAGPGDLQWRLASAPIEVAAAPTDGLGGWAIAAIVATAGGIVAFTLSLRRGNTRRAATTNARTTNALTTNARTRTKEST